MNIQKELIDWAKEVVEDYNQVGLSYYTQSPLIDVKEDYIDLLVLGINPGSCSVPLKEWKFRDRQCTEGITYDVFLMGNPSYQRMREKKEKWSYWDKLCKLLEIAGMQSYVDRKAFVLTNIFFCSTKKESGISMKDYNNLKKHTFKLIDLLKPKCIICLGQKVMDRVIINYLKRNDNSCQITGLPIRYKVINGMKVFGFHHPAYYYSNEEKQLVGHILKYYMEHGKNEANPLPDTLKPYAEAYINRKYNLSSNQLKGKFGFNRLIALLREYIPDLDDYKEDEKCYRIPIGKNKDMKLTISSVTNGTIGIRSAIPINKSVYVTPEMEKLLPLLESLEWVRESNNPAIWLVRLAYKGKTEQEICGIIVNTIKQMENK